MFRMIRPLRCTLGSCLSCQFIVIRPVLMYLFFHNDGQTIHYPLIIHLEEAFIKSVVRYTFSYSKGFSKKLSDKITTLFIVVWCKALCFTDIDFAVEKCFDTQLYWHYCTELAVKSNVKDLGTFTVPTNCVLCSHIMGVQGWLIT